MANSTIELKKRLWETRRTLGHGHGVVDKLSDGVNGSKINTLFITYLLLFIFRNNSGPIMIFCSLSCCWNTLKLTRWMQSYIARVTGFTLDSLNDKGEVDIAVWPGIPTSAASKEKDVYNFAVGTRPSCDYLANLID